jgi:hypothetical protein
MDKGVGYTTSYLAGYSQPSYTTPHATNWSAPYVTSDIHNLDYLYGHGRISGHLYGHMTYGATHTQLQNFCNTMPKDSESVWGESHKRATIHLKSFEEIMKEVKDKDFQANQQQKANPAITNDFVEDGLSNSVGISQTHMSSLSSRQMQASLSKRMANGTICLCSISLDVWELILFLMIFVPKILINIKNMTEQGLVHDEHHHECLTNQNLVDEDHPSDGA